MPNVLLCKNIDLSYRISETGNLVAFSLECAVNVNERRECQCQCQFDTDVYSMSRPLSRAQNNCKNTDFRPRAPSHPHKRLAGLAFNNLCFQPLLNSDMRS